MSFFSSSMAQLSSACTSLTFLFFSCLLTSLSNHACKLLTVRYVMQTNLCKLSAAFAQPIGGCLKALKEGMGSTDPQVSLRVADWLALHINNHDFIWSWHRWENVLELPPYHPVR